MALLTAGTKLTTSLKTLQFQPSGMSPTDLGNLMELIKGPSNAAGVGGDNVAIYMQRLQNGRLFIPTERAPQGYLVNPGDWIMVDGSGWPIVVPGSVFSTSWQHS
jgi:hypothetical protein